MVMSKSSEEFLPRVINEQNSKVMNLDIPKFERCTKSNSLLKVLPESAVRESSTEENYNNDRRIKCLNYDSSLSEEEYQVKNELKESNCVYKGIENGNSLICKFGIRSDLSKNLAADTRLPPLLEFMEGLQTEEIKEKNVLKYEENKNSVTSINDQFPATDGSKDCKIGFSSLTKVQKFGVNPLQIGILIKKSDFLEHCNLVKNGSFKCNNKNGEVSKYVKKEKLIEHYSKDLRKIVDQERFDASQVSEVENKQAGKKYGKASSIEFLSHESSNFQHSEDLDLIADSRIFVTSPETEVESEQPKNEVLVQKRNNFLDDCKEVCHGTNKNYTKDHGIFKHDSKAKLKQHSEDLKLVIIEQDRFGTSQIDDSESKQSENARENILDNQFSSHESFKFQYSNDLELIEDQESIVTLKLTETKSENLGTECEKIPLIKCSSHESVSQKSKKNYKADQKTIDLIHSKSVNDLIQHFESNCDRNPNKKKRNCSRSSQINRKTDYLETKKLEKATQIHAKYERNHLKNDSLFIPNQNRNNPSICNMSDSFQQECPVVTILQDKKLSISDDNRSDFFSLLEGFWFLFVMVTFFWHLMIVV